MMTLNNIIFLTEQIVLMHIDRYQAHTQNFCLGGGAKI